MKGGECATLYAWSEGKWIEWKRVTKSKAQQLSKTIVRVHPNKWMIQYDPDHQPRR